MRAQLSARQLSEELKPYKSAQDIQLRLREAATAIALSSIETRRGETCDLAFDEINALRARIGRLERVRDRAKNAVRWYGEPRLCPDGSGYYSEGDELMGLLDAALAAEEEKWA